MDIQYHTYTVADVRAWLNECVNNGLSEQVISKVRANAIIHNPYVEDDMVIVVSATDGDKIVGFTAMFPDNLVRPQEVLSCPTTLYADADYAEDFIGYSVTKLLHDTANGRLVIGSDVVKEASIIDKLLGLTVEQIKRKRYIFNRKIGIHSMRSLISCIIEPYRRYLQKQNVSQFVQAIDLDTHIEYSDFIDNETYQFIVKHSENDMYLRSQEMLNWRLRYPFMVNAPLYQKRVRQNLFSSHVSHTERSLAKVYEAGILIGVYYLVCFGHDVSVGMLYTEDKNATKTYDMLLLQVLKMHPKQLFSQYPLLNKYIDTLGLSLKSYNDKFYYTHPINLPYSVDMQVQGIDGDMLA